MKPVPGWVYAVGLVCVALVLRDNGCSLDIPVAAAPFKSPNKAAVLIVYDADPAAMEARRTNFPDQDVMITSNAPTSPRAYVQTTLKGDYRTMGIKDAAPLSDTGWQVDAFKAWQAAGSKPDWILAAGPQGYGINQELPRTMPELTKALSQVK